MADSKETFWDQYDDGAGLGELSFLTPEEKQVLIDNKVAFPVNEVRFLPTTQYGARYIVVTEIGGETRALGFAVEKVFSRDRLLKAIGDYLQTDGAEPPVVRIVLDDRSQVLERVS